MWIVDGQSDGLFLFGLYGGRGLCHHLATGVQQSYVGLQRQLGRLVGTFVGGLHIHLYHSLALVDSHQAVGRAPLCQMHLGGFDEPHVAVDARARVPARVVLLVVAHAHGNHVLSVCAQIGRQVIHKRGEARRTAAQQVSVQVHLRVVVGSFEVDKKPPPCPLRGESECFPIPADAAGQIALARTLVGRHGLFDAPVVGQRQAAPCGVVEAGLLHGGLFIDVLSAVYAQKAPVVVQQAGIAKRHLCPQGEWRQQACCHQRQQLGAESSLFHVCICC